ncbi:MAG: shikimate dehydrogenase, partial [Candidatus Methanofastidiosa archaeon]|nr:shikimate dehydrogenase [Candidatus Methanofastidiosa archaeon]
PAVQCNRIKLERSIASKVLIPEGEIIRKEMLHLLSPGDGFQWKDINKIINKKAAKDINANEIIYPDFLK